MYTLYIDTHFVNLVLALFKDGKLIEKEVVESNKHSEYTISLLEKLLDNNNLKVDNLNSILVINGPGSFTGVRIGIVVAKIIAFTKNIPVKTLSYLEAMALNFDCPVLVGIRDRNGMFVGNFNGNHELVEDYVYMDNKHINNKDIKEDIEIDLMKVYEYMKDKDAINPHLLKPLYVKKIEVMKND